jgi:hypothetical protein
MRRLSGLAALACLFGSAAAQGPREVDLPGPFHPFNVTGKHEGTFHSFVTAHDLDPAVLIFTSDLEVGKPLEDLLRLLDGAVEKNRNARLAVFVVFLDDARLKDVVTDDDERDARARALKARWEALKLKHVVFALDSKANLRWWVVRWYKVRDKYVFDDKAETTVFLYRRYKVLARHDFPKGGLNDDAVKEIMRQAKEYLGAERQ